MAQPAEIYRDYFVPGLMMPLGRITIELAAPQPGESALDLACGTGVVAHMIAPLVGAQGRVAGLDISPVMLALAQDATRPSGPPITWREGDAAAIPWPDATFDLVVCQHGLQFFRNRALAVAEMHRALRPGGRVVASVWQTIERHPLYHQLYALVGRTVDEDPRRLAVPFSLDDAGALATLFESAGFEDVDVLPRPVRARFPEPQRFVRLTVTGAAAALLALTEMDPAARAAVIEELTAAFQPYVQPYVEADEGEPSVIIDMAAYFVRASSAE
jgi:ubiquinone/menaquinone biosynthesis C-methylase UbiE